MTESLHSRSQITLICFKQLKINILHPQLASTSPTTSPAAASPTPSRTWATRWRPWAGGRDGSKKASIKFYLRDRGVPERWLRKEREFNAAAKMFHIRVSRGELRGKKTFSQQNIKKNLKKYADHNQRRLSNKWRLQSFKLQLGLFDALRAIKESKTRCHNLAK